MKPEIVALYILGGVGLLLGFADRREGVVVAGALFICTAALLLALTKRAE